MFIEKTERRKHPENFDEFRESLFRQLRCNSCQDAVRMHVEFLRSEDAGAAGLLDLLLGGGAEELGLDDHRQLGKMTFAEHFEVSLLTDVDDRGFARDRSTLILRKHGNQLVQIDDGTMELVPLQMVSPHTDFTEVTRMVLVKVDSVVMLTTGVTATTRMLAVLADATMAVAHVTSQLSRLLRLLFRHD